jgi:hypothetical protein
VDSLCELLLLLLAMCGYVILNSSTRQGIDIPITNVSQMREDVETLQQASEPTNEPGRSSANGTGEIASFAFGGDRWKLELGAFRRESPRSPSLSWNSVQ